MLEGHEKSGKRKKRQERRVKRMAGDRQRKEEAEGKWKEREGCQERA